jgi:hypothetical protein
MYLDKCGLSLIVFWWFGCVMFMIGEFFLLGVSILVVI